MLYLFLFVLCNRWCCTFYILIAPLVFADVYILRTTHCHQRQGILYQVHRNHDFLDIDLLLIRQLLNQWFPVVKLKSSFQRFLCHNNDLINCFGMCYKLKQICCNHKFEFSWFTIYHRIFEKKINTINLHSGTVAAYTIESLEFTTGF